MRAVSKKGNVEQQASTYESRTICLLGIFVTIARNTGLSGPRSRHGDTCASGRGGNRGGRRSSAASIVCVLEAIARDTVRNVQPNV
jgi:hypothetical protein